MPALNPPDPPRSAHDWWEDHEGREFWHLPEAEYEAAFREWLEDQES